jgi:redox-sensitive bicupin YhaK (pirin superfamily)
VLADVALEPGGRVPIAVDHPERAVVVLEGEMALDEHRVPVGHLAVLTPSATPVISGAGQAMVLGGEPVGPRHIWWNFVHSDPDRIEAAKADWTAQRFPTVPNDHHPWVPLP